METLVVPSAASFWQSSMLATPPETSSSARLALIRSAAVICSWLKLSSRMRRTPSSRASC